MIEDILFQSFVNNFRKNVFSCNVRVHEINNWFYLTLWLFSWEDFNCIRGWYSLAEKVNSVGCIIYSLHCIITCVTSLFSQKKGCESIEEYMVEKQSIFKTPPRRNIWRSWRNHRDNIRCLLRSTFTLHWLLGYFKEMQ